MNADRLACTNVATMTAAAARDGRYVELERPGCDALDDPWWFMAGWRRSLTGRVELRWPTRPESAARHHFHGAPVVATRAPIATAALTAITLIRILTTPAFLFIGDHHFRGAAMVATAAKAAAARTTALK
jgi:hypothetical protein